MIRRDNSFPSPGRWFGLGLAIGCVFALGFLALNSVPAALFKDTFFEADGETMGLSVFLIGAACCLMPLARSVLDEMDRDQTP